jgi:hypothetical protein
VAAWLLQAAAVVGRLGCVHGRMNYKDTKPYMSTFLSVDLLTEFAAFCFTDFIDWRYINSWFVFSNQLVNCCPHGRMNYFYLSTVAPLLYLLSDLLPSPPFPMYSIYRQCVTGVGGGVGGGEMYCGPYSAGVLHSVSDQIQNLQNCFTTPNKNDQ